MAGGASPAVSVELFIEKECPSLVYQGVKGSRDPPSPPPPPSGIVPISACRWDKALDQAIPQAAILGGLRRSRTGQIHIGELPKLPALGAPIETVKERRRSHQNTFFCRILTRACYDVKIRVEVYECFASKVGLKPCNLAWCFNVPTRTIASSASGETLLPGPLSISQKSQASPLSLRLRPRRSHL